jgi:DinB superfamily
MTSETSEKTEFLNAIEKAISKMNGLLSSLDENKINRVPYKDSWTAGQVSRHVSKSINGMAKAMRIKAKRAERSADEKIPMLKNAFLDFSNKMKSPPFIVPEEGLYEIRSASTELKNAFENFKESALNANLSELPENLPLGAITKLEILHFVMFHTQRHLYQLTRICAALKDT